MATKYWRTAVTSGTWGTAGNWSDISPTGAQASQQPNSSDDCIIPNGVTVNSTAPSNVCGTLTFSGFGSATPARLNANSTLTINGTAAGIGGLTLLSDTVIGGTGGTIAFTSTSANTIRINTAGVTLGCNVRFGVTTGGIATSVLESNLVTANNRTCSLVSGTLTLNKFNLSCGIFLSTGSLTRRINFTQNPLVDNLSNIYVTSISTADILDLDGSNFSFTGQSSFILTGNTASNITSTIVTIAAPVNVKVAPPITLDVNGNRVRTGVIAVDSGSNFLSLDLSQCNGSFSVTSRIINLYGPFDIGLCISSGTLSSSFGFQLRDRPVGALPAISESTLIPILFNYNASPQNGIRIADLTVFGGNYCINSSTSISDDFTMSGGKLTIDDSCVVSGAFLLSGGTLELGPSALAFLDLRGSATHSGGTLRFLSFESMYVNNPFTVSGEGVLDLGPENVTLSRLTIENLVTTSAGSYTIRCDTAYNLPEDSALPGQIVLWGASSITNMQTVSSIPIVIGDVGFVSINDGSSVSFTDISGKFYYTFAGSSSKVTISTCNVRGLDTSSESGTIALSNSATANIQGPLNMINTFSGGSGFIFNLNGTGTEQNPTKFSTDCIAPVRYNINSGYYRSSATSIEIATSFYIAPGATFECKRGSGTNIQCSSFRCEGTLKHNSDLSIALPSSGATAPNPFAATASTTLKSTDGITSGIVYLQYDLTSTATRTLNSITSERPDSVPADFLNLQDISYFSGSGDNTQVSGFWRNIDTAYKDSAFVTFNNVSIYGDLVHRYANGNITFRGSNNAYAESSGVSGFSDISSVTVAKSPSTVVRFNHPRIQRPVIVTSGILALNSNEIFSTSINISPTAVLSMTGNISITNNATLTVQPGGTVIPTKSTIFLERTTLNGGGATYHNIRCSNSGGVTSTINGNNTINTIEIGSNSALTITGNNTIGSITKINNGLNTTSNMFINRATTNTVNNITGYNTGFVLGVYSTGGGAKPIIRRNAETPWQLGVGSSLDDVNGATATGTIVDGLIVESIDFLTDELVVASQSDKFFLLF